jgi:hypothetical protein
MPSVSEPLEDTRAFSAEQVAALLNGAAENEDERGAPERVAEPMYSTDQEGTEVSEPPGDFEGDQELADREPKPGNAPAPGQRPSESGSTPSDIATKADEDAHRNHTVRRRPK